MTEEFTTTAKRIGDELIDISESLALKMEKWSDVPVRPNSLSDTECVGFITKESPTAGLDLVIDIQAAAGTDTAILRTWAIASTLDDTGNERFNNIQLDFAMDYDVARAVAQKGEAVTHDDIRRALHEPTTTLSHTVVSNQSGLDATSQQPLGERYDVTVAELGQQAGAADKIGRALHVVLPILKHAAAA